MAESGKCQVKRCRQLRSIGYMNHGVCNNHWSQHCDDGNPFNLKEEFGIKEEHDGMAL